MSTRSDATILLKPTLQRLAQLAQLGPDWDTYGGVPPSSQAITIARRFLFTIVERFGDPAGERVRPYAVVPLADGGVQLEWRGALGDLELEIGPQGKIGYLFVHRRGTERDFEERDDVSRQKALDLVARVLSPHIEG